MKMVSGNFLRELPHVADVRHKGPESASFSSDGRLVVSTASDGARFWRVSDGAMVLHRRDVRGYLEISADGRWLYGSTRFLHKAWAWVADTGRKVAEWEVRYGATGCFVPWRDEILLGDHDRYRLVSLPDGRVLWTFERPKGGNISGRSSVNRDASVAAVMLDRTRVVFLRMRDGEPLMTLEAPQMGAAACVVFDPSARHLAVANETHVLHLWDLTALRVELERLGFGWDPDLATVGR